MSTEKHQVNVHDLAGEHSLIVISSHGDDENKEIIVKFDLIRQSMKFDVNDRKNGRSKICNTIEEAIEVYNEI